MSIQPLRGYNHFTIEDAADATTILLKIGERTRVLYNQGYNHCTARNAIKDTIEDTVPAATEDSTTLLKLCCATNPPLRALQPVEDQFCRETVGLVHLISSGPTKSFSCTKTDCAILSNACQSGFAPGNPHTMGETRERLRCISADDIPDYGSAAALGKSQG